MRFFYIPTPITKGESDMNLVNQKIIHKVFGEGSIVKQDDSVLTVAFKNDTKSFVYPDAFGQFITLKDQETAHIMESVISKLKSEEEELRLNEIEEKKQKLVKKRQKSMLKSQKLHESSQAVFWLDEEEQQTVFTDWQVTTGSVQSGENKGQPSRAARLRPNSAIILTAREDDQPEVDRRIIGLYMVKESFSGSMSDDGVVPSHKKYRIELTEDGAEDMLFWNYYINKNYPNRMTWNSGTYRYFDNLWGAQIIKDIAELKTDKEEKEHAKEFLDYFCQMNAIELNAVPEANGALKQ